MKLKAAIAATATIGALTAFAPAMAQMGGPPSSPSPAGVAEGESAGYTQGNYAQLDQLPDWGGIWFLTFEMPAEGSGPPPQPQLKGEYLANYEAWRAETIANGGVTKRDRSNCSPPGMPVLMQIPQYPFEYLFTPGRVTINQEAWMQTRTIWTDGREHPEDPDPTFNGHSVGHWEGDTLVVSTSGISDQIDFNTGMMHSDQLHVEERIRLSDDDPNKLTAEITLTDPEALAEPFTVTTSYRRDRNGAIIEFQCAENDRNPVNADGDTEFH